MTTYFEKLGALPGASVMDSALKADYLDHVHDVVIPDIVKAEERQRLLAAEVRALPTNRVIPQDD